MGHGRFSQVSQILSVTSIDEACRTDAGLAGLRLQTLETFFFFRSGGSTVDWLMFSRCCASVVGISWTKVFLLQRPEYGVVARE
jgi:hypothetical protein